MTEINICKVYLDDKLVKENIQILENIGTN